MKTINKYIVTCQECIQDSPLLKPCLMNYPLLLFNIDTPFIPIYYPEGDNSRILNDIVEDQDFIWEGTEDMLPEEYPIECTPLWDMQDNKAASECGQLSNGGCKNAGSIACEKCCNQKQAFASLYSIINLNK